MQARRVSAVLAVVVAACRADAQLPSDRALVDALEYFVNACSLVLV